MSHSKYHYIEHDKKLVIKECQQELEPVNPDEQTIQLLETTANQPLLKMYSTGILDTGQPFEYREIYFKTRGYRFSLVAKRA